MKRLVFVCAGILFGLSCCALNISAQETSKQINGGVLNGRAINLPSPVYPPAAKAVRASGTVNIEVTIDEKGNVILAKAISGHPLLRRSSEQAAMDAKFTPTTLEGKTVKVTGVIVYNFPSADKELNTKNLASKDKITVGAINGQATSLPQPKYPAAARAVRASGIVNVEVVIDEEGNVVSTKAISGHPLLKQAAENAAKGAKFEPTKLKEKPVKVTGVIVYNFALPIKE